MPASLFKLKFKKNGNYDLNAEKTFLNVSRGSLSEGTRLYQRWLEREKHTFNLSFYENNVSIPNRLGDLELGMERKKGENILDFSKRWIVNYKELSAFYNSKKFKKRYFNLMQAKRSIWDRTINEILKFAGVISNRKCTAKYKIYFGFGDAGFM